MKKIYKVFIIFMTAHTVQWACEIVHAKWCYNGYLWSFFTRGSPTCGLLRTTSDVLSKNIVGIMTGSLVMLDHPFHQLLE
jgi:hypothetical protein